MKMILFNKDNLEKAWDYLKQVFLEEGGWRAILLGFLPNWTGYLISSILYGLSHAVGFTWQMVLGSTIFGFILGWTYLRISHPLNFVICLGLHLVVGVIGWPIYRRWLRQGIITRFGRDFGTWPKTL